MAEDQTNATDAPEFELPPVTFIGHVNELAFTARAYLGGMPDPETQQPIVELGMAKRMIDTIEMLQQKTMGNLDAPERNYLDNTLYDLRMAYVRMANAKPAPPPTEEATPEQEPSEPTSEDAPQAEDAPQTEDAAQDKATETPEA